MPVCVTVTDRPAVNVTVGSAPLYAVGVTDRPAVDVTVSNRAVTLVTVVAEED